MEIQFSVTVPPMPVEPSDAQMADALQAVSNDIAKAILQGAKNTGLHPLSLAAGVAFCLNGNMILNGAHQFALEALRSAMSLSADDATRVGTIETTEGRA